MLETQDHVSKEGKEKREKREVQSRCRHTHPEGEPGMLQGEDTDYELRRIISLVESSESQLYHHLRLPSRTVRSKHLQLKLSSLWTSSQQD